MNMIAAHTSQCGKKIGYDSTAHYQILISGTVPLITGRQLTMADLKFSREMPKWFTRSALTP